MFLSVFLCVCRQQLKAKNSKVAGAEPDGNVYTHFINGIEKHIKTGFFAKISGAPPGWPIANPEKLNEPAEVFAHGTC